MRDWLRLIICCILGAGIHAMIFLPPLLTNKPEAGGKKSEESPAAQKMQAKMVSQLQKQQKEEQKKRKQKSDQTEEPEEKQDPPPVEEQQKEKEKEEAPTRISDNEKSEEEGDMSGDRSQQDESEQETEDTSESQKEDTQEQKQQETEGEEAAEEGKEEGETEDTESASAEKEEEQTADTSMESTTDEAKVTGQKSETEDDTTAESSKNKKLEKKTGKLRDKEKKIIDTSVSKTEYKNYMQNMSLSKVEGKSTPKLVFAFKDVPEILKVHRYYDMRILALRPSDPSTVVEVRGLGGTIGDTDASYQKITDFNWKNYSNRMTRRTSPFFNKWKNQIKEQNLLPPDKNQGGNDQLMLVSVTPNNVDAYFRHKQLENIKKAKLKPDNVNATIGRFYKTSLGSWVLAIESIQTKEGEFHKVEDFELKKLREGR